MKELLKIEYLKVKHYMAFRIFMLLYVILVPLVFYAVSLVEIPLFPSGSELFRFPAVWSFLTYVAGWVNFLPGILVVSLVCNEISYKTQKQNVIDGMSRQEVVLAKFYVVLALSVIITLYIFIVGLIFGVATSGVSNFFLEIENLFYFFIQTFAFLIIAMFLAVIIRRSSLSVLAFLMIFLFAGLIFWKILGDDVSAWVPFNMFEDLTPIPWRAYVEKLKHLTDPTAVETVTTGIDQWLRAFVSLIYIGGFVFLTSTIMKKRDL